MEQMDAALDVEALAERYGPMVLRRCRQLLHDEDGAMDASQDVFVRLLEHRERLQARYPSSLLYRIATNVCLNRIRDNGRRTTTSDDELLRRIASAETTGADTEARLMLDRLCARHPVSSRTIAVLHYLDNFKDLGIHTEMFSDGIIPLIDKGVITNAAKTLHPGKIIAGFVILTCMVALLATMTDREEGM